MAYGFLREVINRGKAIAIEDTTNYGPLPVRDDVVQLKKEDLIFIKEAIRKNLSSWSYKDEVALLEAHNKIEKYLCVKKGN